MLPNFAKLFKGNYCDAKVPGKLQKITVKEPIMHGKVFGMYQKVLQKCWKYLECSRKVNRKS